LVNFSEVENKEYCGFIINSRIKNPFGGSNTRVKVERVFGDLEV
jgi:hypothetical protein